MQSCRVDIQKTSNTNFLSHRYHGCLKNWHIFSTKRSVFNVVIPLCLAPTPTTESKRYSLFPIKKNYRQCCTISCSYGVVLVVSRERART
jgi:hypothetical protein